MIIIGLGSNIGDRLFYLTQAKQYIHQKIGEIILVSDIYETEAWGDTLQEAFLNQVICVNTLLSAEELLKTLLDIETLLGRVRQKKWAPRTIDLDIIFYNDLILNTSTLTIPHPYVQERNFWLTPLCDMKLGYLLHPIFKKNIQTLLSESVDNLKVRVFSK